MQGGEPFQCLGCGSATPAAMRCASCGGRSFALAHAVALAPAAPPAPPLGKLIPIEHARTLRRLRPPASTRRRAADARRSRRD